MFFFNHQREKSSSFFGSSSHFSSSFLYFKIISHSIFLPFFIFIAITLFSFSSVTFSKDKKSGERILEKIKITQLTEKAINKEFIENKKYSSNRVLSLVEKKTGQKKEIELNKEVEFKNSPNKKKRKEREENKKRVKLLYHEAIKKSQEKKFDQSKKNFYEILKNEALKKEIHLPFLFYNIGLNEYQNKNYAKALGWLRRAVFYSPFLFQARKIIQDSESKLDLEENDKSRWGLFRDRFLSYFSLNFILSINFIFFLFFFFFLLQLNKKKELEEEENLTNKAPFLSGFRLMIVVLFFTSLTLSVFKIYDSLNPWGTVILPEAKLYISPGEQNNILLDLKLGNAVILKEKKGKWIRVLSPKGTTGWVQEKVLFPVTFTDG